MGLNKVIVAPDSFKGTLTSGEVADVIADEVRRVFPDCEIVKMPIADGGEGSVDVILSAVGGEICTIGVLSPDDRQIDAYYGFTDSGTAIIEMAQSSGITRQEGLNPMTSTTYGFGQLIADALDKNSVIDQNENKPDVGKFKLCIGGSATTDGGCGMAAALGVRFYDKDGNSFIPCGETLINIAAIDDTGLDERIAGSSFVVMCDVDNPLYGTNGAAYIYGPQKGADSEQIIILDEGLRHYGAVLEKHFGKSYSNIPGAGGAGGLGAGCLAFLGAEIRSGIDAILGLYDFGEQCKNTDLVITGEGKLDSQSFQGKVLSGILREAGNVPVWSVCGVCDYDRDGIHKMSVTDLRHEPVAVFETSKGVGKDESMNDPVKYIRIIMQAALLSLTN